MNEKFYLKSATPENNSQDLQRTIRDIAGVSLRDTTRDGDTYIVPTINLPVLKGDVIASAIGPETALYPLVYAIGDRLLNPKPTANKPDMPSCDIALVLVTMDQYYSVIQSS